jgi:hypothetical protein
MAHSSFLRHFILDDIFGYKSIGMELTRMTLGTSVYWIATLLLCLLYLTSAVMYLAKPAWARGEISALGYPASLVPLLIAVKLLAVAAILTRFSVAISDLAYAGILYHLLLSAWAHVSAGRSRNALPALIALILLALSLSTQNVGRSEPSPYGHISAARNLTSN